MNFKVTKSIRLNSFSYMATLHNLVRAKNAIASCKQLIAQDISDGNIERALSNMEHLDNMEASVAAASMIYKLPID